MDEQVLLKLDKDMASERVPQRAERVFGVSDGSPTDWARGRSGLVKSSLSEFWRGAM